MKKYVYLEEMFFIYIYCKLFYFVGDRIGLVIKNNYDFGVFFFWEELEF